MALQHSPSIVTSGLIQCLDAGNPRSYPGSGTVWYDASGNSNTGTLTNGPTYTSGTNGYFTFDGVDDYVATTKPTLTSFTLEFWCRLLSNAASGYPWLIRPGNDFIGFQGNTTSATFRASLNNGSYTEINSASLNPGTNFNMYSLLYNGTTVSMYVNGVAQANTMNLAGFGMLTATSYNFGTIGSTDRASSAFSSLKIYNRSLSAAEVSQNFNALRGRYGI
jgi:hypothetical protein